MLPQLLSGVCLLEVSLPQLHSRANVFTKFSFRNSKCLCKVPFPQLRFGGNIMARFCFRYSKSEGNVFTKFRNFAVEGNIFVKFCFKISLWGQCHGEVPLPQLCSEANVFKKLGNSAVMGMSSGRSSSSTPLRWECLHKVFASTTLL